MNSLLRRRCCLSETVRIGFRSQTTCGLVPRPFPGSKAERIRLKGLGWLGFDGIIGLGLDGIIGIGRNGIIGLGLVGIVAGLGLDGIIAGLGPGFDILIGLIVLGSFIGVALRLGGISSS
jgi:hypothetical protein